MGRRGANLALALLVARILANDPNHAVTTNDLAVAADFLYRSQYFHGLLLYLARKTIRALDKSYGVSSTVTLSPGRMRM